MAINIRKLEQERLENLTRNFQWEIVKVESPPGEIIVTMKKTIEEFVPPGTGGPE